MLIKELGRNVSKSLNKNVGRKATRKHNLGTNNIFTSLSKNNGRKSTNLVQSNLPVDSDYFIGPKYFGKAKSGNFSTKHSNFNDNIQSGNFSTKKGPSSGNFSSRHPNFNENIQSDGFTTSPVKRRRQGNGLEDYMSKITDESMPKRTFRDTSTGASFTGADDWNAMRESIRRDKSIDNSIKNIDESYAKRDKLRQESREKEDKAKLKRMKTIAGLGVAGAYAGTDMASRYKNGGSITRNEKGERDIVGLPLL